MATVDRWTGRQVRALRESLRMTQVEFARHIGVSDRTAAYWDSNAGMTPRSEMQAALDTALVQASPEARERFADALAPRPSAHPASGASPATPLLDADEAASLRRSLALSQRIDPSTIALLVSQTENIRLQDRRLGAAVLRDQVNAHIGMMESLLRHAVTYQWRSQLAGVLADTATLAAWQSLDLGLFDTAWRMYESAKAAALESQSPAHYAHATSEQAYVLVDLGMTREAVECVAQVIEQYGAKVPDRLRAWLHAVYAEVCAADGAEREALRSLERADHLLPSGPGDPDLPFLSLDASHLARWRGHCLARLGVAGAVDDAASALDAMDRSFTRAEAGLRCDYATALAHAGEREEAEQQLAQARHLATMTSSSRQLRRIETASALLV